jgi:3-hydroxy-3-methylglutaryl CoA synthase
MVVVDGYGGYVPLYRVERDDVAAQTGGSASGETAVPARDENHVTMASEAAETALARADAGAGDLGAVVSASITDPFAEHGIAAHVAYRLQATGDVRTADLRSSGRAATDALLTARDFVRANDAPALVIAADVLPAEAGDDDAATAGAGAGAVVLAPDAEGSAASLQGVGQATTGFVERHRRHGEPAEGGDAKFEGQHGFGPAVEQASGPALAAVDGQPSLAVVAAANQRMASSALRQFGDVDHVSTFDDVGAAGTASFYLDLVHLLETADAGESAVALCYGAGGADAVTLETGSGVGADAGLSVAEQVDAKEYVTYAKHLEYREPVDYQGVTVS